MKLLVTGVKLSGISLGRAEDGDDVWEVWAPDGAATHNVANSGRSKIRMQARPGRFIEIVATGWPRERDSKVFSEPHFGEITGRLWSTLRAESLRAMGRDTSE